jgi:hypothetical protein
MRATKAGAGVEAVVWAVSPIGYIEVRDRSSEFKRVLTSLDLLALVAAGSVAAVTLRRLLD